MYKQSHNLELFSGGRAKYCCRVGEGATKVSSRILDLGWKLANSGIYGEVKYARVTDS